MDSTTYTKQKAQAMYYGLRAQGVSHSVALGAVVEMIIGNPSNEVPQQAVQEESEEEISQVG